MASEAAQCHSSPYAMVTRRTFAVQDYDLGATLTSGQAFRWQLTARGWVGVIGSRWVRLESNGGNEIAAETAEPVSDWAWLMDYLQLGLDLKAVLESFPNDEPMRAAVKACRGLRLLRQEPWECLASFILSSTKQIVQIQQIVALLTERYGEAVTPGPGETVAFAFPSAARLAGLAEADLRVCKMGFRSPYLLAAADAVASGRIRLADLGDMPAELARAEFMKLAGVGPKIANCVLLFAYGFQSAFPVDVWVAKALQSLYFPRRRVKRKRLEHFAAKHFGPQAGYAQQYLFHYMRTKGRTRAPAVAGERDLDGFAANGPSLNKPNDAVRSCAAGPTRIESLSRSA